jgi:hypothetical protein
MAKRRGRPPKKEAPGFPRRSPWKMALELSPRREVTAGDYKTLAAAIDRGADLRVYTEFTHEEHIAPFTKTDAKDPRHNGLIREVIDFRQTILVNHEHVAGVTLYRQPLEPTQGFNGTQPKMSFFLYNMTGHQACANLVLDDGASLNAPPGSHEVEPAKKAVPKMSAVDVFDAGTTGPSRNFIWDMEVYRFFVWDRWDQVLAHNADGSVTQGSFEAIEKAQSEGREIKVGIRGLCRDLVAPGMTLRPPGLPVQRVLVPPAMPHEVFSSLGSGFLHTGHRYYEALTHPIVRIAPGTPMQYASQNWDVSWVSVRTDGFAVVRTLNPFTRRFTDRETRLALRWFVR